MSKAIAIIRLRGKVNVNYNIEHTLSMLKLHKPNHAVVYTETDSLKGMLAKIKDVATWGTVSEESVVHLLQKRGELAGKNRISDSHIKETTEFDGIESFAKAVCSGEAKIKDIPGIQPVFRLSPPRKGFRSLKYAVTSAKKGDLGNRGEAINDLLNRMV